MGNPEFKDRNEAGELLAKALLNSGVENPVILAMPRGGVPVAARIADALGAPLDLVFVRKIGAPGQPELALGAVVDGDTPQIVVNDDVATAFGIRDAQVQAMAEPLLVEIEHRRKSYLTGHAPLPVAGKSAILVDDGIATGASIKAAIEALRARDVRKIIVAVPVAPSDALGELEALADDVVCLSSPEPFLAVGAAYQQFPQTSDQEVIALMQRLGQLETRRTADA